MDNPLNRNIAEAHRDTVLLALFDQLNEICRAVVSGQLRSQNSTGSNDHYSFVLQDEIVRVIQEKDQENAAAIMKMHLEVVRDGLIRAKSHYERDLKLIIKKISMKQIKYMD